MFVDHTEKETPGSVSSAGGTVCSLLFLLLLLHTFKSHSLCLLCQMRSRSLSEEQSGVEVKGETDGYLREGRMECEAEGVCPMNDKLLKSTF